MTTQKPDKNKTPDTNTILQHDHDETVREQDRERAQNRHSFDSHADISNAGSVKNDNDASATGNTTGRSAEILSSKVTTPDATFNDNDNMDDQTKKELNEQAPAFVPTKTSNTI